MTENERYCVRAGYWHNYTGIGRCEDENLTTNEVCDLINEQHETITYLKEVIDSRDNEISELGKQRNYLVNENKALQLKIKMLEQVKPIKDIPESIEVRCTK